MRKLFLIIALLCVLPMSVLAFTQPFTVNVTYHEVPGPSPVLFDNPYYTCTRNFYVNASTGLDSRTTTQAQNSGTPWLTIGRYDAIIGSSSAGDCINVAAGTYALGVTITKGGTAASSSGYVVYRCQTLNGCSVTDQQSQTNNSAFFVGTNYVILDGFSLNGGNGTNSNTTGMITCQDINCGGGNAHTTTPHHHVWFINNIIHGYGEHGISMSNGEYFYSVHNTMYDNSHDCNGGAQGSGISMYLPVALSGYTPTADDGNNKMTGNTGTLFHQFIMWNVFYNNYICAPNSGGGVTDGNGIILDDWQADQFSPAGTPYTNGALVAFNVSYNNGQAGVHAFNSSYATFANNSIYNNNLDNNDTGSWYTNLDDNGSYGSNMINNIVFARCGANSSGINQQNAIGAYGLGNVPYTATTTLNGAITNSQTSITITSAAQFPGGSTFNTGDGGALRWNNSYALPGGNLIKIDSEILRVTNGWNTTGWTVTRGYSGTTAASHSNGATVTWLYDYFSGNSTVITGTIAGSCTEVDNQTGSGYSSTLNQLSANPLWSNVGNTSAGTYNTQPNGTNFSLTGSSPAINFGSNASPFDFLPAEAKDGGACYHTLTTCP
jgi:hypothetical protein